VGWTSNNNLAMDALYLNPGSEANVWFYGAAGSLSVESSNPAVLSVPSSLTMAANPVSFIARGQSPGSSTIRIFTAAGTVGTLTVDVVPAGTKPRWPGALDPLLVSAGVPFDHPISYLISPTGTAPFTGERATGTVTLTSKGHEVARVTLAPSADLVPMTLTYYAEEIGANPITVVYSGDTNFLPITMNLNVNAFIGLATIVAGAARAGTTASVHIRVIGSPSAAPTGTITVSETGIFPGTPAPLTTTSPGVAEADVKLTNISAGQHTFILTYSGDTRYSRSEQSLRMVEARSRGVKH
jgi:hypothetical protein